MSPTKTTFLKIENTRIGMRNFRGEERPFNPPGRKNFCVFIDNPEDAEALKEDGWNIRYLDARDPDDERQAYLPVAISFDFYPPDIWIVSSKSKTKLNEQTLQALDWAEIQYVDIQIRPYHWEQNGKSGIKAYVKSMFVRIVDDELQEKYQDIPEGYSAPLDD